MRIMDHPMTKQESYAERRKLFKDIWETSMNMDEKDDIMKKPRVIKTLRLSEMDRCTAGKKKKQKIKNLRAVCNRLLDFCDRQDADDLLYEQMAAQGKVQPATEQQQVTEPVIKKIKKSKVKRNIQKAKSMPEAKKNTALISGITSERKLKSTRNPTISRYTSPIKVKRTSIPIANRKALKPKINSRITAPNEAQVMGETKNIIRRKINRKKLKKRNKNSSLNIPSGINNQTGNTI